MSTIGVVVFSFGGMRSLEMCLESVRWADRVIVLHLGAGEPPVQKDGSPSDKIERASSMEQVSQRFREMKTDWVLHLWGEERLDEKLQEEIVSLCKKGGARSSRTYRLEVRSRLLNRWVRGSLWGPSPALRLSADLQDLSWGWWHGTGGKSADDAPLLQGWIEDYSVEQLGYGLAQMNDFSTLCAERLAGEGIRFGPVSMIVYSFWVGARLLTMNRVVAKGLAGVTFSILAGTTVLLAGAKRWEKGIKVQGVLSKRQNSAADRGD